MLVMEHEPKHGWRVVMERCCSSSTNVVRLGQRGEFTVVFFNAVHFSSHFNHTFTTLPIAGFVIQCCKMLYSL
jgi:hypothetical protein